MKGAQALVWITIDQARGQALITGKGHDQYVYEVAPRAPWSRAGHGWVLSLPEACDLHSLCWAHGVPCRERERPT